MRKHLEGIVKAKSYSSTGTQIAQAVDMSAFADFNTHAFLIALFQIAQFSGSQVLVEIKVPEDSILFNQVNDRAVDFIKKRGAELVTQIDESTRNDIADTIAEGLESKSTLDEIIDSLSQSYSFSEERAQLIAETEIGNANSYGSLAGMYELREQGAKIKKAWLPDADACDECLENGSVGFIDLDDQFPSGDDAPLLHCHCRCDLASEIED